MKKKRNIAGYVFTAIAMFFIIFAFVFLYTTNDVIRTAKEENGWAALVIFIPVIFMLGSAVIAAGFSIPAISLLVASIKEVPQPRKTINIVILSILVVALIVMIVLIAIFIIQGNSGSTPDPATTTTTTA